MLACHAAVSATWEDVSATQEETHPEYDCRWMRVLKLVNGKTLKDKVCEMRTSLKCLGQLELRKSWGWLLMHVRSFKIARDGASWLGIDQAHSFFKEGL